MSDGVHIDIFSDGSCLGNPGPGGWAVILRCGDVEKELHGGYSLTTNNRMEILAAIQGLEALKKPCDVDLYTDSRYVRDSIEKGWLAGWCRNGWRTAAKKPVKNRDLWERFLPLLKTHSVRLHWVAGHAGHSENERVDLLARSAASRTGLLPDPGFDGKD